MGVGQQQMEALQEANRIRALRSELRRRMGTMQRGPALMLAAGVAAKPPEWAITWRAEEFLRRLPQFGTVTAYRACQVLGISSSRTLGALNQRQRDSLVWFLEESAEKASSQQPCRATSPRTNLPCSFHAREGSEFCRYHQPEEKGAAA